MCRFCNVRIDWLRKDTCIKHCQGQTHKTRKQASSSEAGTSTSSGHGAKRQLSIQDSLLSEKRIKTEKKKFTTDTCRAFLEANIPLEKVDHPSIRSWMNEYIKGAGDLPLADTLRRTYVQEIRDEEMVSVKEKVRGLQVGVLCDETTDRNGNCVFLILLKLLECKATSTTLVGGMKILNKGDAANCGRAVVEVLTSLEISLRDVVFMSTDSARYMTKCAQDSAFLFSETFVHVQCWAHKLNLVGNIWQADLVQLNSVVSAVKMAFLNTRKRKHMYLAFLKSKYPENEKKDKLFPMPVLTRWNSWHNSVEYINEYLEDLLQFFNTVEEGGAAVQQLKKIDSSEQAAIQCQATFVVEHCKSTVQLITTLEGSTFPFVHLLGSRLSDLKNGFDLIGEGLFGEETQAAISKICKTVEKSSVKSTLRQIGVKCNVKLSALRSGDSAKNIITKMGKLFCPRSVLTINVSDVPQLVEEIPILCETPKQNLVEGYMAFKSAVRDIIQAGNDVDILPVLLSLKSDHSIFIEKSVKTLWIPVSNVDVERGFSSYGNILTDRRTTLTSENVELMLRLSFKK